MDGELGFQGDGRFHFENVPSFGALSSFASVIVATIPDRDRQMPPDWG